MPVDTRLHLSDPVPERAVLPFLLLAFGIAWGIFALFVLFPDEITALMGAPSARHPMFILAVWAPAIAAFLLVWWHTGTDGVGRFVRRALLWRMPGAGWAALILGPPVVYAVAAAAMGREVLAPVESLGGLLAVAAFMAILGPMEEWGWRGLLLPLVQRRMAPVWAGLVVGLRSRRASSSCRTRARAARRAAGGR
jgi:uncharacterized protein